MPNKKSSAKKGRTSTRRSKKDEGVVAESWQAVKKTTQKLARGAKKALDQ